MTTPNKTHTNWVRALVRTNLELMVSKSLKDCHARGVDSILFDDTPESRIRLFVARENHELWKNTPYPDEDILTVAYHGHRCDLTLDVVHGTIDNLVADHTGSFGSSSYAEFIFDSKIKGGSGGFRKTKAVTDIEFMDVNRLGDYSLEKSIFLPANVLHTIWVPMGEKAAWFVYEGKEDPDYKPICYSNADLENFDASDMYQPMDKDYLLQTLEELFGPLF